MKPIFARIARLLLVVILVTSMFPAFALAANVYVPDAYIVSQGTAILKGTFSFNCETGAVGSGGDIWWEQLNTISRRMVPQAPAKIVNLGVVNFDLLTPTLLDDYAYSSTPIIGSNDSTNKLVVNDVFAVKTKLGNYTKIKILSYGYNLTIQWVTYRAPLATPALVSPAVGQILYNYPRTTTLSWQPVPGATYYKVERQYYSTSWQAYSNVYVYGNVNTSYTFSFVGDQKGRWRVTAYSNNTYSATSAWREFSYLTKPQLATPVLVSPVNNVLLYNYPRTTTLSWKPVPGAAGYLIERQFYSGSTWSPYTNVTLTGVMATSYTFNFVGAQPGRWRVTAIAPSTFNNSIPSAWSTFTYKN